MARALTEIPEAEPRNITARVLAPLALAAGVSVALVTTLGSVSLPGTKHVFNGELVDDDALKDALDSGKVAGAALGPVPPQVAAHVHGRRLHHDHAEAEQREHAERQDVPLAQAVDGRVHDRFIGRLIVAA